MKSQIKKIIVLILGLTLSPLTIATESEFDESVMIGDRVYSITNWKKAAENGNADAQYMLGLLYLAGKGVDKNNDLGIDYIKKAAHQDMPEAQAMLGAIYFEDQVIKRDVKESKKWLDIAASNGYAKSQYYLGLIYYDGMEVEKDNKKAKNWFARSCNNKFKLGCEAYQKIRQQ